MTSIKKVVLHSRRGYRLRHLVVDQLANCGFHEARLEVNDPGGSNLKLTRALGDCLAYVDAISG
jgi:hypothetical protein